MSTFRKVIVVVLCVLLFISGSLAVIFLPFETILMNPGTIPSALSAQKIYSKAPEWIGEILSRQKLPAGQGSQMEMARYALSAFRPEDYEALIRIVAPETYLQKVIENAIDQVFNYLNHKDRELRIEIDLREVKNRLTGKPAEEILKLVFSTLPACKPADLLKLPLPGQTVDPAKLPYCQPPVATQAIIYPLLTGEVAKYASLIPDKFLLTNEVFPVSFSKAMDVFWNLRSWFAVISLGALGLVFLLGLLCFFPYSSMRPVGIPLILVGLFSIIFVTTAAVASTPLLERITTNVNMGEAKFFPEFMSVFTGILFQFFFWTGAFGVALTGIGIILTFVIRPAQPRLERYQTGFRPNA